MRQARTAVNVLVGYGTLEILHRVVASSPPPLDERSEHARRDALGVDEPGFWIDELNEARFILTLERSQFFVKNNRGVKPAASTGYHFENLFDAIDTILN
jgi:hypothetical protein